MTPDGPQIKFIPEGSSDCPVLQISRTDVSASRELFHAIREMRERMTGFFALHDLPGFEGCRHPKLIFEIFETDLGVQSTGGNESFSVRLSYDGWVRVEDLLSPFCRRYSHSSGFQWLDETSDISLLFSPGGGW